MICCFLLILCSILSHQQSRRVQPDARPFYQEPPSATSPGSFPKTNICNHSINTTAMAVRNENYLFLGCHMLFYWQRNVDRASIILSRVNDCACKLFAMTISSLLWRGSFFSLLPWLLPLFCRPYVFKEIKARRKINKDFISAGWNVLLLIVMKAVLVLENFLPVLIYHQAGG